MNIVRPLANSKEHLGATQQGPSSPHPTILSSPTAMRSSPERSIERLQRRAEERYHSLKSPMSSPLKDRDTRITTHPQKYTLRGERYLPFTTRKRDERRSQRQLEQRGGMDNMEKFVVSQERLRADVRLRREADLVASKWELDDIEQQEMDPDPYEMELEMMLKREQEELEMLMNEMVI